MGQRTGESAYPWLGKIHSYATRQLRHYCSLMNCGMSPRTTQFGPILAKNGPWDGPGRPAYWPDKFGPILRNAGWNFFPFFSKVGEAGTSRHNGSPLSTSHDHLYRDLLSRNHLPKHIREVNWAIYLGMYGSSIHPHDAVIINRTRVINP